MQEQADPPLADEVRRVVDRLRTTPLADLGRPAGRWTSRAEAGRELAQALADAAAAAEGEPVRTLPTLGAPVVADQVAVCAADLVAALAGRPVPPAVAALATEVRRAL